MEKEIQPKGEIIIYKDSDGPGLEVNFADETVWVTQSQLAALFGKDVRTVNDHIKNIFKEGELDEKRTIRKFRIVQTEGKRQVSRDVEHYNLDMAISVGYRVNSKKGTQFRIWATQTLHDFLLKGYAINERRLRETHEMRLKELQEAHKFLRQAVEAKRLDGYEKELVAIINDYTQTWVMLTRYDDGDLKVSAKTRKSIKNLDYARAKKAVEHFKARLIESEYATGTFGHEQGTKLADVLRAVSRRNVSLEEKSALIFLETIKNRPFVDGNKRIASLLFVIFLIENNYLYDSKGERKFNDNGLIALALLVEESKPSEKSTLVKLISNLVTKK